MTDSKIKDDPPTGGAIGILAFVTTMLIHEALGHGGICIATGGHVVLFPVSMQCSVQSRTMVAAGPIMNFVAGVGLWFLLRSWRSAPVNLRYYLWLTLAFNLFNGAGYLMLGGLANFGDWAVLFGELPNPWSWRIPAVVIGGGLFYFFMNRVALVGSEFLSNKQSSAQSPNLGRARVLTLTLAPVGCAGVAATSAALWAPASFGWPYVLLAFGASFGAGIGLAIIHDWAPPPPLSDNPAEPLTRSVALIVLGVIALTVYTVVIGPGLRIPL